MKSQLMARAAIGIGFGILLLGVPLAASPAGAQPVASGGGGVSVAGPVTSEALTATAQTQAAKKLGWTISRISPDPVAAVVNGADSYTTITYSGKARKNVTIHVWPTATCGTSTFTCYSERATVTTKSNPVSIGWYCNGNPNLPYTGSWYVWLSVGTKKVTSTPAVVEYFTCEA